MSTSHMMTQYCFKAALKKFSRRTKKAVHKELLQLHQDETFEPQEINTLTKEQICLELESIMIVKYERDGTVKGRFCANGCKQ